MDIRDVKMRGFTLIELIVYVALLTAFLGMVGLTVNALLAQGDDVVARGEVLVNQELIERKLQWLIEEASAITVPAVNSSSTTLELSEYKASNNPAVFSLTSNQITLARGGGASIPLTNNRVIVTSFTNEHFSNAQASSSLRITLTTRSAIKQNVSSTAVLWFILPSN